MRILVFGGTSFVGRHAAEAALAAGHDVTLSNRGRTNPDLFPGVPRRVADRATGDYSTLVGETGTWDAVIDVNAYVPRQVGQALDVVGEVGRYVFVSTVSVYDAGTGERVAPEHGTEELTNESYGALKVACEDDLLDRLGDALSIVRPGIVAGPHDPSDRFTWWPRRLARGGDVLLPDRLDQPVQVIDGRDLGAFLVHLAAGSTPGAFDAVGPAEPCTLEGLARACTPAGVDATLRPAPFDFFEAHEVPGPPLLLPPDGSADALFSRPTAPAIAAGLVHRPLAETAADTLAWDRDRGTPDMPGALTAEREAELLALL